MFVFVLLLRLRDIKFPLLRRVRVSREPINDLLFEENQSSNLLGTNKQFFVFVEKKEN